MLLNSNGFSFVSLAASAMKSSLVRDYEVLANSLGFSVVSLTSLVSRDDIVLLNSPGF